MNSNISRSLLFIALAASCMSQSHIFTEIKVKEFELALWYYFWSDYIESNIHIFKQLVTIF